MALFGRKNSDQGGNGVSQIEFQNSNERRWPLLLAALAAALLIALALFYTGRWAYRSIFGNDEPNPKPVQPTNTNLNPQQPAKPQPTPAPAPPPPTSQIPDSGPGDVMALFVGTTLAAAGLHYIVSVRRGTSKVF